VQEIFIAIILIFDASTGTVLGAGTAAFEDKAVCEAVVADTLQRAQSDLQIHVEGACTATPLIGAE